MEPMKLDINSCRVFPATAMEVCWLASGEKLTVLDADEFQGQSAKTVKQSLAAQIGINRFRQKLFWEDGCEIQDDEVFTSLPVKVNLLVLEFLQTDAEQDKKMNVAAEEDDSFALENLLKSPRDPNALDRRGFTPLHWAAIEGHVGPAQLLLEAGADLEARNPAMFGMVPLHLAAGHGHLDVVRVLLEAGAETDPTTDLEGTPMHLAAAQGRLDIVRLLVESCAKTEPVAIHGFMPFHVAAQNGHLDIVRFLVEVGVRIKPKTDTGHTALHLAATNGHLDIVRFLVESGADCHATLMVGKTALDVASEHGHDEIVRFLSELS